MERLRHTFAQPSGSRVKDSIIDAIPKYSSRRPRRGAQIGPEMTDTTPRVQLVDG